MDLISVLSSLWAELNDFLPIPHSKCDRVGVLRVSHQRHRGFPSPFCWITFFVGIQPPAWGHWDLWRARVVRNWNFYQKPCAWGIFKAGPPSPCPAFGYHWHLDYSPMKDAKLEPPIQVFFWTLILQNPSNIH